MHALVTYPYRDRETLEVRYAGDSVDLTDERFAELEAAGFVSVAEVPAEDATPEEPAEEGQTEAPADEQSDAGMTVAELRAAIEAAGGFAPKKATKAQLTELYGAL